MMTQKNFMDSTIGQDYVSYINKLRPFSLLKIKSIQGDKHFEVYVSLLGFS